ncbi:MAG: prolyl oligopeptidase family serine peptidase [Acidobacteriota bacterium]|nr:prolyl oligopeptidase family serine peptidase [Acidobacteriota bacterium]
MKNHKLLMLIVFIALFIGLANKAIAEEGTFTLEQVLSSPYPKHLVAAKHADRIAWVFYVEGEHNVWTAAVPDFKPVNLTGFVKDEVFEIPGVKITDDGSIVVYVRGGYPNSKGWVTNPKSDPDGMEQAIWAVKTIGGKPWKVALGNNPVLSPDGEWILLEKEGQIYRISLQPPCETGKQALPEQLFKAAGRNGNPCWSPDGKRLAFVSGRDDHSFIGVFEFKTRKITWLTPSVDRDSSPQWSPDGKQIAFLRRPGAQYNEVFNYWRRGEPSRLVIWIADIDTGKCRELWNSIDKEPEFYSIRNFQWAVNNRILFTAEHDNWNHVFSMSLSGGEPVDLTPGEAFVEHLGLSSDGETLFFSSNLADIHGRHIWKVATSGGKAKQLTKGGTIGTYPVALSSGKNVAFLHSTAKYPMSIALVPADGSKAKIIAPMELPAKFPLDELVVPKLVIVKAEDGLEIPCQLFLPKGAKAGDGRPGIVYTHGGPIRQMLLGWHYMEFYSEAYGINQYFANRGYVVISINYRSGIGYGRSFRDAPNTGRKGASEYQDVVAGARYLQERPEVDPERVGLWGLSYGGLLTAMGLARNSDIFKAGVDMAGVHDWSQFVRSKSGEENDRKVAFESSPVASVKKWTSPVLFVHGDDDRNVPFSQTVDLVQKLRLKGGVHIELVICPDEPHEFLLYKNRMGVYNAGVEFLDRFLRAKIAVK